MIQSAYDYRLTPLTTSNADQFTHQVYCCFGESSKEPSCRATGMLNRTCYALNLEKERLYRDSDGRYHIATILGAIYPAWVRDLASIIKEVLDQTVTGEPTRLEYFDADNIRHSTEKTDDGLCYRIRGERVDIPVSEWLDRLLPSPWLPDDEY